MSRTGLGAQFGYAAETTYGSRVVPARFNEITEEGIQLTIERIESEGLRAGRRVTEHWVPNKKGAAGDVSFEVGNKGFGLLFKHILGAIATATATPGAYDHTATIGDLYGLSLTLQVGRPDVNGTTNPFDYPGAKITEAEFTNEVDGNLMLGLTFDAYDERTDQSLASASYASGLVPLTYVGGTITVDGGAPVQVTSISTTINNGLKTDRYFIRGNTLKKEPVEETEVAGREITGTINTEFKGLTEYNRFVNGTEAAIVCKWQGSQIVAGANFEVELSMPRVRFDGETPVVAGADILEQPQPFKALQPVGQSALSIRYRTSDASP